MKVYLSHSIRGPKGKDASHADMKENCRRVLIPGNYIRRQLPSVELYIPAEHEDFVQRAYDMGLLTEQQILAVDCKIIDSCDAVIIFLPLDDNELQGGRLVEYNYTVGKTNKPVFVFHDATKTVHWLSGLMLRA